MIDGRTDSKSTGVTSGLVIKGATTEGREGTEDKGEGKTTKDLSKGFIP